MKKLAPIMAIGSGLLAIVVGTLSLLMAHNFISNIDWINTYNSNTQVTSDLSKNVIFSIQIGFGALAVSLGIAAFKKAKGFAAFLLLVVFAAILGMSLYIAVKDHIWNTMTIVSITIYSLATIGLIAGLFIPKN